MVIVQGRFLEDGGYNCFFKNRMKLARAEREINNVGDRRNKNRSTGFDKPGGNRIRITLFIRTVEKNFGDFRLRTSESMEINGLLGLYKEERNIPIASLDCFYTRYLIIYSNFRVSYCPK